MARPKWENLADFFDTGDFAITAIIQTQGSGQISIPGIFDNPALNAELGEYDMELSQPGLLCKEEDATRVLKGDIAVINEKVFDVIKSPESDGTGLSILHLDERRAV
ncbi:MAG: hypothetical protein GY710_03425 [Desulfobacteraceae bacterium]|nr:hypothetical protein [Desulfobacteraceae bacterium]